MGFWKMLDSMVGGTEQRAKDYAIAVAKDFRGNWESTYEQTEAGTLLLPYEHRSNMDGAKLSIVVTADKDDPTWAWVHCRMQISASALRENAPNTSSMDMLVSRLEMELRVVGPEFVVNDWGVDILKQGSATIRR